MCYYLNGLYEDAIAEYKKVIEIKPFNNMYSLHHVNTYCNLGNVYLLRGDLFEVAERYKIALEGRPLNE